MMAKANNDIINLENLEKLLQQKSLIKLLYKAFKNVASAFCDSAGTRTVI
jgi:hypothetical protein